MSKTQKIIYWVATVWLAFGMTSSAILQLLPMKEQVEMFEHLGYPFYLMHIIAIWKLLGVLAIFLPKTPILKEWAYAGFFFVATGAIVSHIAVHDGFGDIFPGIFLAVLTVVSWYFRPECKKVKAQ